MAIKYAKRNIKKACAEIIITIIWRMDNCSFGIKESRNFLINDSMLY